MVREPYKDIPEGISSLMKQIINPTNSYQIVHARRTARTIETLLDQNPKGKLLELGTSKIVPLVLNKLVPELELHVTDFDLTKPTSGEIELSIDENNIKVPVYRVDLETQSIPVPDNTFDYVLCCEVIEHMELDPMFMIAEINRVLKPSGMLILTTPNITSSWAIWKILRGYDPYFYMQYRHSPKLYRHNYEYSPYSISKILKAGGFSGSVWTEDSFEDGTQEDINKLNAIGYNINNTGDNIFCVGKKTGPVIDRNPSVIYAN
jgi:2-polyprenyl-3-methyl-5-hydroxy-6-metoxy-1,4-benzoquinol methylase